MSTNNKKNDADADADADTDAANKGGIAVRLARKNILELSPYRCARDDYSEGILLDANENAFGPPIVLDGDNGNEYVLERYPDPYQIPLKEKIAEYRASKGGYKLATDQIFVGVGSDEAIDLLMRIFCIPGHDKIVTTPPTYGMYKVCAKVNDVDIIHVPLTTDFNLQIPKILDAMKPPEVKLVFLCSPGNPTSKALPLSDMEQIANSPQAKDTIIVIDEAYVDFSTKGSGLELVQQQYPNIVVLQTLSKAFGLAAIRCGFCMGPPDIIQLLNNVKAPYNVNALTSQMAIQAFDHVENLQKNIDMILEQREYVASELEKMDFVKHVYPSDANFVLFRLSKNAQLVYKQMADVGGVVTRYRGNELHCNECIRVTIGTPDENRAFLQTLQTTYDSLNS